jgi:hypothetical protein
MTSTYWEFLVQGAQLQSPIPIKKNIQRLLALLKTRKLILSLNVARVRPRTSKGITDLLLLCFKALNTLDPIKKHHRRRDSVCYLIG